jgi:glycosyltransferase involved in cell wall biosynthesis
LYFHHACNLGGAPKSLALLIGKLVPRGVEAIVAMPRRPGNDEVIELFKAAGAQVIEEHDVRPFHASTVAPSRGVKQKLYSLYGYFPLQRLAQRLVADLEPDLVHLNSTCLVAAAQGAHQAKPDVPIIAHVREPILRNTWGEVLRRLNRRHVDHFISIDAAGDASLDVPGSRRSIVRNSADDAYFRIGQEDCRLARAALGWNDNRLTLISLSRLAPSNGALELAEAMSRIETRLPRPVRVVLAGFGPPPGTEYEAATRTLVAKGESCEAMPFLKNVYSAIAACDAIIAPFVTSHSARSVFEGAAAARPALVSRLPNLTEMIIEGESGLSFTPGDDQSLFQAISRFCVDDFRLAMGTAARNLARGHHKENRNSDAVKSIYDTLLLRKQIG